MFVRFVFLLPFAGLSAQAVAPSSVLSTSFSALPTSTLVSFTPSASVPTTPVDPIHTTTITLQTGPEFNPLPTSVSFPAIGSIPRNYTAEVLEQLWDLVGSVEPPPFTTTAVPSSTPIPLPPSPPPLYPTWYAPQPQDIFPNLKFPEGFVFGVATAAYQVEGAAKSEGKGPTGWDWASHIPGVIADGTNGDIVDLQYFLYKVDTARVAALGVNAHSFSISWARIFPFGTKDSPVNQAGLDHYSDMINYSLSLGVEPVVTLVHWDVPLAISAFYGGFTSPESVDDFVHYAKTVFAAYKGLVKTWYTFNEPQVYCSQISLSPFSSTTVSGLDSTSALYRCAYYVLLAHAGAVKAFREMGMPGEIAFKNAGEVGKPWRSNATADVEAHERSVAFGLGLYSDPIYNTGDWPEVVKQTLNESVLPRFTDQQKKDLKGSADFYAIDAYRSSWIAEPPEGLANCIANPEDANYPGCNVQMDYNATDGWPVGNAGDTQSTWLAATPSWLRYELIEVNKRWPTKKILISEYGFTEPAEGTRNVLTNILDDSDRTNAHLTIIFSNYVLDYYMTYLGEALLSIHEDGVPLGGMFHWSMIDNAEWGAGISTRFGIQYVNYTSFERAYKRSAMALMEFFKSH